MAAITTSASHLIGLEFEPLSCNVVSLLTNKSCKAPFIGSLPMSTLRLPAVPAPQAAPRPQHLFIAPRSHTSHSSPPLCHVSLVDETFHLSRKAITAQKNLIQAIFWWTDNASDGEPIHSYQDMIIGNQLNKLKAGRGIWTIFFKAGNLFIRS